MRIHLDRIRDESFRWQETLEISPEDLERSEVLELTAITCEGIVSVAHPGYLLRAKLTYEQQLACNRCLQPTQDAVASTVELLVLSDQGRDGVEEGAETELEEDDLSCIRLEGDEFDTNLLFLEQIQLNVPMKPLCRSDCAGLCPRCGANQNATDPGKACRCSESEIDPRWSGLEALRSKLE